MRLRDPGRPDEEQWSANLAAHLVERLANGRGALVTWYNHVSLQAAVAGGVDVAAFDLIGIDGILLRALAARRAPRTSADLVLPRLLRDLPPGTRVALVGTREPNLSAAADVIRGLPSHPSVVLARDGYAKLPLPHDLVNELRATGVDVVVLGLGAPHQDHYASALVEAGLHGALVLTCGGWLDQVAHPRYYPAFAYRLKVNWLVRVAREPRRLWRRYTIEAVAAFRNRDHLRAALTGPAAPALERMWKVAAPQAGSAA